MTCSLFSLCQGSRGWLGSETRHVRPGPCRRCRPVGPGVPLAEHAVPDGGYQRLLLLDEDGGHARGVLRLERVRRPRDAVDGDVERLQRAGGSPRAAPRRRGPVSQRGGRPRGSRACGLFPHLARTGGAGYRVELVDGHVARGGVVAEAVEGGPAEGGGGGGGGGGDEEADGRHGRSPGRPVRSARPRVASAEPSSFFAPKPALATRPADARGHPTSRPILPRDHIVTCYNTHVLQWSREPAGWTAGRRRSGGGRTTTAAAAAAATTTRPTTIPATPTRTRTRTPTSGRTTSMTKGPASTTPTPPPCHPPGPSTMDAPRAPPALGAPAAPAWA